MNFLKKMLPVFESQIKEGTLEDVMVALDNPAIRKYWIQAMEQKVQFINSELDVILDKPDKNRIFDALVIERRALLRSLTMILDERDRLDREQTEQERQNRTMDRYHGAAAPLNLDVRQ